MCLRRIGKLVSIVLLYFMLTWYAKNSMLISNGKEFLEAAWQSYFSAVNAQCIYWIALRLGIWISILMLMVRLETPFTIYLFLRKRNYISLFLKMYIECILYALVLYSMAMAVMAVVFWVMAPGTHLVEIIGNKNLVEMIIWECLDCLNICLVAYILFCLTRRMETGVIVALSGRILLGIVMEGEKPGTNAELCLQVLLAIGSLIYSAYSFTERIKGEA